MKDVFFKTIMLKGESGSHVSSFVKTSTVGNVDTYTITFDDGTTEEFTVTNGNGIYSIDKTGTSGLIDTYTITYENGNTETFEITNGSNGAPGYEVPAGTIVYYDNSDLPQGYEPATNPDASAFSAIQTALDNKQNLLVVDSKTSGAITIAANSSGYVDISVTKSGYTALGIVGITGTGTTGIFYSDFYMADNVTARVYFTNTSNSSREFSLNMKILYYKN